ncbi:MAG: helix-turn-helix domain-containing protein [Pseudomonadota bacterium]
MSEQHLSEKALARRWNISHRTLQRWRAEGIGIPYIKIGGRIRYPLNIIEHYEAENTHKSTNKFINTDIFNGDKL